MGTIVDEAAKAAAEWVYGNRVNGLGMNLAATAVFDDCAITFRIARSMSGVFKYARVDYDKNWLVTDEQYKITDAKEAYPLVKNLLLEIFDCETLVFDRETSRGGRIVEKYKAHEEKEATN